MPITSSGSPLVELIFGIRLFMDRPPDRAVILRVYEEFHRIYGHNLIRYCPTRIGSLPRAWESDSHATMTRSLIPNLYFKDVWGYGFDGVCNQGMIGFMFHGYRPNAEAGKGSFVQLDLPWDTDPNMVRRLISYFCAQGKFLWGSAGYYLRADLTRPTPALDAMYALAMRFRGAEAQVLDATAATALQGYTCVNWITVLGPAMAARESGVLEQAREKSFEYSHINGHHIYIAESLPNIGDRNKNQLMPGYERLSVALAPIQAREHAPLGGACWDGPNTQRYMMRFVEA